MNHRLAINLKVQTSKPFGFSSFTITCILIRGLKLTIGLLNINLVMSS